MASKSSKLTAAMNATVQPNVGVGAGILKAKLESKENLKKLSESLIEEGNLDKELKFDDGRCLRLIDVNKIVALPENRDIENSNIEGLEEIIERHKLTTAITVVPELDTDSTVSGSIVPLNEYNNKRAGKETGRYILIAGHRRVEAYKRMLKKSSISLPEIKKYMPALVINDELTWGDIVLLNVEDHGGATPITQKERRQYIKRIHDIYTAMYGEAKKKECESIIKNLSLKKSQAYRYYDVSLLLKIQDLVDAFDNNIINLETASKLCKLPESYQLKAVDILKKNSQLTVSDVEIIENEYISSGEMLNNQIKEKEHRIAELEAEIEQLAASNLAETDVDKIMANEQMIRNKRTALSRERNNLNNIEQDNDLKKSLKVSKKVGRWVKTTNDFITHDSNYSTEQKNQILEACYNYIRWYENNKPDSITPPAN